MEKRVKFEAFDSLNDLLRAAVKEKFGDNVWVSDFSASEVVFSVNGEEGYKRVGYTVEGSKAKISDYAPTPCERKTEYVDKTESVLASAKAQLRESEKPE